MWPDAICNAIFALENSTHLFVEPVCMVGLKAGTTDEKK
jgi:hypothetical protein